MSPGNRNVNVKKIIKIVHFEKNWQPGVVINTALEIFLPLAMFKLTRSIELSWKIVPFSKRHKIECTCLGIGKYWTLQLTMVGEVKEKRPAGWRKKSWPRNIQERTGRVSAKELFPMANNAKMLTLTRTRSLTFKIVYIVQEREWDWVGNIISSKSKHEDESCNKVKYTVTALH